MGTSARFPHIFYGGGRTPIRVRPGTNAQLTYNAGYIPTNFNIAGSVPVVMRSMGFDQDVSNSANGFMPMSFRKLNTEVEKNDILSRFMRINTFHRNLQNILNTGGRAYTMFNNGHNSFNTRSNANTIFDLRHHDPTLKRQPIHLVSGRTRSSSLVNRNDLTSVSTSEQERSKEKHIHSNIDFLGATENGRKLDFGSRLFSRFDSSWKLKPSSLNSNRPMNNHETDILQNSKSLLRHQFAIPKDSSHFGLSKLLVSTVHLTTDPTTLSAGGIHPDLSEITEAGFSNTSPNVSQITTEKVGNTSHITDVTLGSATLNLSQNMSQMTETKLDTSALELTEIMPLMTTMKTVGNDVTNISQLTNTHLGSHTLDLSENMSQTTARKMDNVAMKKSPMNNTKLGSATVDLSANMPQTTKLDSTTLDLSRVTAAELGSLAVLRGSNNFKVTNKNAKILSPSWLNANAHRISSILQTFITNSNGRGIDPILPRPYVPTVKPTYRTNTLQESQKATSPLSLPHPTTAFDLMANIAGPFHDPIMLFSLSKMKELDLGDNTFISAISDPIGVNEALHMRVQATPTIQLMASTPFNDHTISSTPTVVSQNDLVQNVPVISNNNRIPREQNPFLTLHSIPATFTNSAFPPHRSEDRSLRPLFANPDRNHLPPPGVQFLSETVPMVARNAFF
ncbi:uncharacterized protein [Argopecten irradians]|uniref:uncharacterized protein n=1 Tax=Argopecten irradians TaxID=31199 RepID=UPI00371B2604